jgi:hypothetical protein
MKPIYTDFVSQADVQILDATKRAAIIGAAVATAVANSLPLPTTEVDNVASFYAMNEQASVARQVAEFNENLVFDMPACLQLVRSLWCVRYTAAHPSKKPVFTGACGFFESLFGVGLHVDEATTCFLNEHKSQILILSVAACEVLCAMGSGDSLPAGGSMSGPDNARVMGAMNSGRPFHAMM